jgi:hypothetical protein
MQNFYRAYQAWWNEPFPAGTTRDDLDDLRGELALADEWILSTVEPFAERGSVYPPRINVGAGLGELRSRITELRKMLSADDAVVADSYLNYLSLLETVYAEFLKATAKA